MRRGGRRGGGVMFERPIQSLPPLPFLMIAGTSAKMHPREDSCQPNKIFINRCIPPLVGRPRTGEGGARELLSIEAVGTLLRIVLQRRNTGLVRTLSFKNYFSSEIRKVTLLIRGIISSKIEVR